MNWSIKGSRRFDLILGAWPDSRCKLNGTLKTYKSEGGDVVGVYCKYQHIAADQAQELFVQLPPPGKLKPDSDLALPFSASLADHDVDEIVKQLHDRNKSVREKAIALLSTIQPEENEAISQALVTDYPKFFSGSQPFRGLASRCARYWVLDKHVPQLLASYSGVTKIDSTTSTLIDVLNVREPLGAEFDDDLKKLFSVATSDLRIARLISIKYPHLAEDLYIAALKNDRWLRLETVQMLQRFGTEKSIPELEKAKATLQERDVFSTDYGPRINKVELVNQAIQTIQSR